jgi:hypothetical protein
MKGLSILCAILLTALILPGRAAVTQKQLEDDGSSSGNGTTIAAEPNLISMYGSLNSTDFDDFENRSDYHVLNDGALNNETAVTGDGNPWTLTVTLDTSTNKNGYTITGLDAFTGWTPDYVNQAYTISYSTVSDPSNFILFATVTASNSNPDFQGTTLETLLTPVTGQTDIETNVAALQYNFTQGAGDNSHIEAYTQVEAFGYADTPEPSTYALMLGSLALLGCFCVRRKLA